MGIFSLIVNTFKKELELKRKERKLKREKEALVDVEKKAPVKDFSFNIDPNLKFDSKVKAIPELTDLISRIKKNDKLSFSDIQTYFKHFENGHILNGPLFKIKKEFFENAIFQLDRINTVYDANDNIVSFKMVIKDEFTGLDVTLEAPASFFTEFTSTPKLETV